jgi:hypothetical protein
LFAICSLLPLILPSDASAVENGKCSNEVSCDAAEALCVISLQCRTPIADWGYGNRRWMVDFDGDGNSDYYRAVSDPSRSGKAIRSRWFR